MSSTAVLLVVAALFVVSAIALSCDTQTIRDANIVIDDETESISFNGCTIENSTFELRGALTASGVASNNTFVDVNDSAFRSSTLIVRSRWIRNIKWTGGSIIDSLTLLQNVTISPLLIPAEWPQVRVVFQDVERRSHSLVLNGVVEAPGNRNGTLTLMEPSFALRSVNSTVSVVNKTTLLNFFLIDLRLEQRLVVDDSSVSNLNIVVSNTTRAPPARDARVYSLTLNGVSDRIADFAAIVEEMVTTFSATRAVQLINMVFNTRPLVFNFGGADGMRRFDRIIIQLSEFVGPQSGLTIANLSNVYEIYVARNTFRNTTIKIENCTLPAAHSAITFADEVPSYEYRNVSVVLRNVKVPAQSGNVQQFSWLSNIAMTTRAGRVADTRIAIVDSSLATARIAVPNELRLIGSTEITLLANIAVSPTTVFSTEPSVFMRAATLLCRAETCSQNPWPHLEEFLSVQRFFRVEFHSFAIQRLILDKVKPIDPSEGHGRLSMKSCVFLSNAVVIFANIADVKIWIDDQLSNLAAANNVSILFKNISITATREPRATIVVEMPTSSTFNASASLSVCVVDCRLTNSSRVLVDPAVVMDSVTGRIPTNVMILNSILDGFEILNGCSNASSLMVDSSSVIATVRSFARFSGVDAECRIQLGQGQVVHPTAAIRFVQPTRGAWFGLVALFRTTVIPSLVLDGFLFPSSSVLELTGSMVTRSLALHNCSVVHGSVVLRAVHFTNFEMINVTLHSSSLIVGNSTFDRFAVQGIAVTADGQNGASFIIDNTTWSDGVTSFGARGEYGVPSGHVVLRRSTAPTVSVTLGADSDFIFDSSVVERDLYFSVFPPSQRRLLISRNSRLLTGTVRLVCSIAYQASNVELMTLVRIRGKVTLVEVRGCLFREVANNSLVFPEFAGSAPRIQFASVHIGESVGVYFMDAQLSSIGFHDTEVTKLLLRNVAFRSDQSNIGITITRVNLTSAHCFINVTFPPSTRSNSFAFSEQPSSSYAGCPYCRSGAFLYTRQSNFSQRAIRFRLMNSAAIMVADEESDLGPRTVVTTDGSGLYYDSGRAAPRFPMPSPPLTRILSVAPQVSMARDRCDDHLVDAQRSLAAFETRRPSDADIAAAATQRIEDALARVTMSLSPPWQQEWASIANRPFPTQAVCPAVPPPPPTMVPAPATPPPVVVDASGTLTPTLTQNWLTRRSPSSTRTDTLPSRSFSDALDAPRVTPPPPTPTSGSENETSDIPTSSWPNASVPTTGVPLNNTFAPSTLAPTAAPPPPSRAEPSVISAGDSSVALSVVMSSSAAVAVGAASSASVAVAAAVTPSAGAQVARVGAALRTIDCALTDSATTPSFMEHVAHPAVGSGRMRHMAGAVLVTTCIVAVPFAALAWTRTHATTCSPRIAEVTGNVAAVLVAYYVPSIVGTATTAVVHAEDDTTSRVVAAGAWVAGWAMLAALAWSVHTANILAKVARVSRDVKSNTSSSEASASSSASKTQTSSTSDAVSSMSESQPSSSSSSGHKLTFVDAVPGAGVAKVLSGFFDGARDVDSRVTRLYFFEDVAAASVMSLIAGVRPAADKCGSVAAAVAVVAAAHSGYLVFVRPYFRRLDTFFSIALAANQLLLGILCAVAASSATSGDSNGGEPPESIMRAVGYLVLVQSLGFIVQAIVQATWYFILTHRRGKGDADDAAVELVRVGEEHAPEQLLEAPLLKQSSAVNPLAAGGPGRASQF